MPAVTRKKCASTVQNGHQYLRRASDTIHQHRNSLASQLRDFDSRWAHLYTVAPVLHKLAKGRQRPDEFKDNAETLYNDVQHALEHAHRRKLENPEDDSSIIPGPLPVRYKIRPLSKVSSFHWVTGSETASARGAVRVRSPRNGMEPIPESPPMRSATLKRNKTVKRRQSRPRLSFRNPFRNRPTHPTPSSHSTPPMTMGDQPPLPHVDGQTGSIGSSPKIYFQDVDAEGIPKQRRGRTRSSSKERRRRGGRSSSRSSNGSRSGRSNRRYRTTKYHESPMPPLSTIPSSNANGMQTQGIPTSVNATGQYGQYLHVPGQALPTLSHHQKDAGATEHAVWLPPSQSAAPNGQHATNTRSRSYSKSHSVAKPQTAYAAPTTQNVTNFQTTAAVPDTAAAIPVTMIPTTVVPPTAKYVEPHISPTDTRGRHKHKLTKAPKVTRRRDLSIDPVPVMAPPSSYVVPHQSTTVYGNVSGNTNLSAYAKGTPVIPSIPNTPLPAPDAAATVIPALYPYDDPGQALKAQAHVNKRDGAIPVLMTPSHVFPPQVNDRYYTGASSMRGSAMGGTPRSKVASIPAAAAPAPIVSSASAQAKAYAKAQARAQVKTAGVNANSKAPYIIDVIPSSNPAQGYYVVPRNAGYGEGQPQSVTTPTAPTGTTYMTAPGHAVPAQTHAQHIAHQYQNQHQEKVQSPSHRRDKDRKDRGEKSSRSPRKHSSHSHSHSSSRRRHERDRDREREGGYYESERDPYSHSRSKSHSHSSSSRRRHRDRDYGHDRRDYDYDYHRWNKDHRGDRDRAKDRDYDRERSHRRHRRRHHDESGTEDDRHYYSDRSGKSSRSVKYSDSKHPERKPIHRSPPPPAHPSGKVFAFAPLMSKFRENFSMHSNSVRGTSSARR